MDRDNDGQSLPLWYTLYMQTLGISTMIIRRPVKIAYIQPFFQRLHSTCGGVVWMQHMFWCNPCSNLPERFWCLNRVLNADGPSFHLVYRSPRVFFFGRSTYLVSGPCLLSSSHATFNIRQPDHGAGSYILRQIMFYYRQMRVF